MLKKRGLRVVILERAEAAASAWRAHYDGLRLHTAKGRSALPGLKMGRDLPRFPKRADVIAYFDRYVAHHGLDIRTGVEATHVREVPGGWRVDHSGGHSTARVVVFATGLNGHPNIPALPGYDGQVLHSSQYRRPGQIAAGRVLVVGFGNSGGDLAMEMARDGRKTDLSVRGPVNMVPETILGVPTTSMGMLRRAFGPRLADRIAAPLIRAKIGRPEEYGFTAHSKGPQTRLVEDGKVPLIDPGVLPLIREGRIAVRPGIAGAAGREVQFTDETRNTFDAVVFATGYKVDLRPLLGARTDVLDDGGAPRRTGGPSEAPGLYFIAYRAAPEGQLRRIGIEARAIAAHASG